MSNPPDDPLGHAVIARRLSGLPEVLAAMLAAPVPVPGASTQAARHFILTGTGSSEAHARYLATLLNFHTDRSASYVPLSAFATSAPGTFVGRTLIVFSQGLSPNAQLALARQTEFAHAVLFTATTPEIADAAGKPARAAMLRRWMAQGGELVLVPAPEEYTVLIRFVGPLAGYLTAMRFAVALGAKISEPTKAELLDLLAAQPPEDLRAALADRPQDFANGFHLVASAPLSDFAQNLAWKFVEGLYWRAPLVSDFLQFAHGPFQQLHVQPAPTIVLQCGDSDAQLAQRTINMLHASSLPAYLVRVDAPARHAIFGFEALFNRLVFARIRQLNVDQVNWPGRGQDEPLYGYGADSNS